MIAETIPQITDAIAQIKEIIPQVTENVVQVSDAIQNTAATSIDWNELIYVLVGAIIGFAGSIIVMLTERALDRKGTIQIFYRKINQRGEKKFGWGFDEYDDGKLGITIPIVFEVQNTSNTTRVIRDVSLLLYSGNTFVEKMLQSSGKHVTRRTGNTVTGTKDFLFGAEKGSYSFVLPPRSIQREECEFCYVIYPKEKELKCFDTVIARYYDERNRAHTFKVMSFDKVWTNEYFEPDKDWCVLDEKVAIPQN
mgnify:CR=1 FL=1